MFPSAFTCAAFPPSPTTTRAISAVSTTNNGLSPSASTVLMSPPCATRYRRTSTCAHDAAACSGVYVFSSWAEGEIPAQVSSCGGGSSAAVPDSTSVCTRARSPSDAAVQMFVIFGARRRGGTERSKVAPSDPLSSQSEEMYERAKECRKSVAGTGLRWATESTLSSSPHVLLRFSSVVQRVWGRAIPARLCELATTTLAGSD